MEFLRPRLLATLTRRRLEATRVCRPFMLFTSMGMEFTTADIGLGFLLLATTKYKKDLVDAERLGDRWFKRVRHSVDDLGCFVNRVCPDDRNPFASVKPRAVN